MKRGDSMEKRKWILRSTLKIIIIAAGVASIVGIIVPEQPLSGFWRIYRVSACLIFAAAIMITAAVGRCPYCGSIGTMGQIFFSKAKPQCRHCGAEEEDPFPQNYSKKSAIIRTVVQWLGIVVLALLVRLIRSILM